MKIITQYVGPWDNSYPMYRSDEPNLGFHAYGTTHHQAISNLLGIIKDWRESIGDKTK